MVIAVKVNVGMVSMGEQVATLPDGRKLGYCIVGKGQPVIYFHGTASSRLEVLLLRDIAESSGLQIVGIDRPGYGLSTYHPRRTLQDFNGDVNYLADYLGFERFGVLGWSGGGAFALAYLAQFHQRVTKAVVASTPALPFDVSRAHNIPFVRFMMKIPYVGFLAMQQLRRRVLKANGDVSAYLKSNQAKSLLRGYSPSDLKFFSNPDWARLMYQSMAEAFRQNNGVKAVVEEHQLFMKPWGISFARISSSKLVIWHGADDKTCLVSNGYLLSQTVAGSLLEVFPAKGHCVMFDNQEKLAVLLTSD
jgi:pimeloyl-ACP methyl ester carboxylesterase